MDIDKSLYMKEFLELRSTLGCVVNPEVRDILHTNLYDEFLPRKVKTEVKEVVAEIEEKTIQILDKGQLEANKTKDTEVIEDNSILFNDADDTVNEKTNEEDTNNIMDVPFVIDDDADDADDAADAADADAADADEDGENINDVPDVDLLGGGHQLKKIVINPNYVAVDS
tara:strand:- start:245 stop:754 length:510 start_codon:yes stop_codon:yes gene_type:complete